MGWITWTCGWSAVVHDAEGGLMMTKPICTVGGMVRPGAMCGRVIVGGELCGAEPGACHLQGDAVISVGSLVTFEGDTYRVAALGDRAGTLDIFRHPDEMAGDRFRNVPLFKLRAANSGGCGESDDGNA